MKATKARKEFKQRFGQANHFLITGLIGLNEIEKNPAIIKPEEFNTSWNPKDKVASARRSRNFLLDSFLSHAVDGIDMYLTSLNRSPKPVNDSNFDLIFEKAKRSVYLKVIGVHKYLNLDLITTGMVLLLITWRNNLTHYFAENELLSIYEQHLKMNSVSIARDYCNLQVNEIIAKSYEGSNLTFKEVASLISATHKFIESVDDKIIKQIDFDYFSKSILQYHFKTNKGSKLKHNNLSIEDRKRFEFNILQNLGAFDKVDFEKLGTSSTP